MPVERIPYIEELYDGTGKPLHAGQSLEVEEDVEDDDKGLTIGSLQRI